MRCQTCGKRINLMMKECPNCGAMIPRPDKPASAGQTGDMFDWKSMMPSRPAAPPTFGGSPAPPDAMPPAQMPGELPMEDESEDAPRRAVPVAPRWTQLLFPLLILLWVGFRLLTPTIERFIGNGEGDSSRPAAGPVAGSPELLQLTLCERIEDGGPVGISSSFSRSRLQNVNFYSAWRGERGTHRFAINWISPGGKLYSGPQRVIWRPDDPRSFLVTAELPMGEFTATGAWRVEVVMDGTAVASDEFTVVP